MSIWFISQGATLPVLSAQLLGGDGQPLWTDPTGVSAKLVMKRGNTEILNTPIVVAANGYVSYDWAAGGTAAPGEFASYFWVTFPGGTTERIPNPGFDTIHVDAT
jgi:hypothetical protein